MISGRSFERHRGPSSIPLLETHLETILPPDLGNRPKINMRGLWIFNGHTLYAPPI